MVIKNLKENMLRNEKSFSPYATKDNKAIRLKDYTEDFRPNFYRDIDRIINSLSYTRYIDKTQVFSLQSNDHISKRMVHVQIVSKIARTMARALKLNEDLTEAIALAHDIGHVPFGHVGERILNDISLSCNEGYFRHNAQSVRTMMYLEKNGEGNNLSIQVLDGALSHNGEFVNNKYCPKEKTVQDFLNDYHDSFTKSDSAKHLTPMTLEGCIVRISDIIGYLGRDIEDAIILGVFDKKDLPEDITKVLGDNHRDIVNNIIIDIVTNSYDKPYIKMSPKVFKAIVSLKNFNYKNIYCKANTKKEIENYEKMFKTLFRYYLVSIENKDTSCSIFQLFLNNMNEEYLKNNSNERKVIDYIAGMTDDFFTNEYKKII